MLKQVRFLRALDPRAFPIAVKITLGLVVLLSVAFVTADGLIARVVLNAQIQLALDDMKDFSRTQGFRVVDLLGQETAILTQLGGDSNIQAYLRSHDENSQVVVTGRIVYDPFNVTQDQIISFRRTHDEFDSVVVVDDLGHILAADPQPAQLRVISEPNWTWFTGAFRDGAGATFISNPFDDKLTGIQQGIHIAVPIFDQQNSAEIIGVVYGIWNMSNAAELTITGGGREGLIIQRDGAILLSPNASERGQAVSARLLTQVGASTNNAFVFTNDDGAEFLYGHTHLPELGISDPAIAGLGWVMLVRRPASALESSITLLQNQLRVALFAVGGAVTLLVLLFSRILFLPLRQLTEAARRIETGHLNTPIPQFALDEIGRLASVLSKVVTQLVNRVQSLNSAVEISRKTSTTLDVNYMLADVTRLLSEQFGYPDVRVYLSEPTGKRVHLHAAVGGEGERLLRAGHRLDIDETSLVGRAMLLNEPTLGGSRDRMREAGLASESTELALPLYAGGQGLGAIILFSRKLQEFTQEEIDILRLVADQVSSSIQNARLFEQSAANVREIEALNRRLTRQAWEEYVTDSGALRHTLDPEQDWPAALAEARKSDQIKAENYNDESGRSVLAAPLILRGEAVGTLAVTRPGGENWTRDEVLLLEAIASRMAIIAEGIRLVDESTQRAEREQRVNEISANLLQRATSVETVLRSALGELGGALGSDRISLRIGKLPVRDDHQIGTGPLADSGDGSLADNGHDGESAPLKDSEPQEDGNGGEAS